jgi:predicted transcriptional regulator
MDDPQSLSRREREIMDIVYRLGRATAEEVRQAMAAPPSYSAVRALMRLLEDKGRLRHRRDGRKYVYAPVVSPERARRSALRHLLRTFFDGSVEKAVASLIDLEGDAVSDEELERLSRIIKDARSTRKRS